MKKLVMLGRDLYSIDLETRNGDFLFLFFISRSIRDDSDEPRWTSFMLYYFNVVATISLDVK